MVNTVEISGKGCTYKITRRIIQRRTETVLRVRVQGWDRLMVCKGDEPVLNEHRDYVHITEGDAAFNRHIAKIRKHTSR